MAQVIDLTRVNVGKPQGQVALQEQNHAGHLADGIAELRVLGLDQPLDGVDNRVRCFCRVQALLSQGPDLLAVGAVVGNIVALCGDRVVAEIGLEPHRLDHVDLDIELIEFKP